MPILILGIVGYVVYLFIKRSFDKHVETQRAQSASTSVYSFTKKYHNLGYTGVLSVRGKSQAAINALEFKEIHDIHVTTTPDKLVYTGATVGGVTTGGFHVQKGGTSASLGAGTGRWGITYRFASQFNGQPWGETVVYMQLTYQLFAEARQDALLQKLIVTDEERQKWKRDNPHDELSEIRYLLRVIGMDKQTADRLKNWLGGNK